MVHIKYAKGRGQASCKGCMDKGKWNVTFRSLLWEVKGKAGLYCDECVKEFIKEDKNERADNI